MDAPFPMKISCVTENSHVFSGRQDPALYVRRVARRYEFSNTLLSMNRSHCGKVLDCGDGVGEVTALALDALKTLAPASDTTTPTQSGDSEDSVAAVQDARAPLGVPLPARGAHGVTRPTDVHWFSGAMSDLNRRILTLILSNLLVLFLGIGTVTSATNDYFKISVVDEQTGRGVPLVELTTTSNVRFYTDSNGIIAFDEPGLMEQEVFFHIKSHGYEFPKDGFGNRGQKLKPVKGGTALIKIKRLNIAERLYRITGEGIYRDSVLVGHPVPIKHPLLNGQVMGQDTVIATPYRGRIYWFWGDTERVSYPLGNFAASGATSELPGRGGLDHGIGVELTYFV